MGWLAQVQQFTVSLPPTESTYEIPISPVTYGLCQVIKTPLIA